MQYKVVKQEMNGCITALLNGKVPTLHMAINLLNAKVGTIPPSYAVIPLFISCFTAFYCIDPYFIFRLTIKKNTIKVNNYEYCTHANHSGIIY